MIELLALGGTGWGLTGLILAGLYATSTVGVTGGPNHGEHPFTTNLVHLGVAAFWALRGWPPGPYWTYLGILGAAIVLSATALGLNSESPRGRVWATRAGMAALYLGLLAVVLFGR